MRRRDHFTAATIRAARELLGWSQEELASRAGMSRTTLSKIERDNREGNDPARTRVQETLEALGIVFIAADDQMGSGLRYKDRHLEDIVAEREAAVAAAGRESRKSSRQKAP